MLGLELLVKVAHVEIEIVLPVERQHPLHHRHRHPLRRWLAPPPVEQAAKAKLLIALPPTPHLPVADPDDLRRLPPGDLLRFRPQYHFLYLHGPLHRGPRVAFHASHGLLLSPPAKRTDHLLSQPDISCANGKYATKLLEKFSG